MTALKKVKLNMIFAQFLLKLSKVVTQSYYEEFTILVLLYKKSLNEIGWEKLKKTMIKEGNTFNDNLT